jgi:hypothetical protein
MAKRYRKHRSAKHTKHAGVLTGLLITAAEIVGTQSDSSHSTPITELGYLITGKQKSLTPLLESTQAGLMNYKNYVPAVAGAVVTYAPRIPIVRIAAAPINTAIKSVSRQRWGL